MSCHSCHEETPCVQPDCTCAVRITTDCVTYNGENLPCSGITKGTILTQLIQQLDAFICSKFDSIAAGILSIVNIGNGAEIYAGDNNLGEKTLRSLTDSGELLDIIETEEEIDFSINEEALSSFISDNQKEYAIENVGGGAKIYKEGADTDTPSLKTFHTKTLGSSTLVFTENENELLINTAMTASIPALYVNNLYVPTYQDFLSGNTKGLGTLSKPFTDIVNYIDENTYTTTPNTAIQNALDAYVGTGSRLLPQLQGWRIIVQNNNSAYTFNGDLSYSFLDIHLEGNVNSTTIGFLVDMDNALFFDEDSASCTITISEDKTLQIVGDGFNNSGNDHDDPIPYQATKQIALLGEKGIIYSQVNNISKYILNADANNTENNNDGGLCFLVRCNIRAEYQGVYKIGGRGRIDVYGSLLSGGLTNNVNTNLRAFHQTGGQIRLFPGSVVQFFGAFDGTPRTDAITFDPYMTLVPVFIGIGAQFSGNAVNLFNNLSEEHVQLEVANSPSSYGLAVQEVFYTTKEWRVTFKNNVLGVGSINSLMVDLTNNNTLNSVNYIGNQVIETLVKHNGRYAAKLAGLPSYSAFLNYQVVNATDLVAGQEYMIVSPTGTDFTAVGAANNLTRTNFIATGAGTGTGTAAQYKRDIVL